MAHKSINRDAESKLKHETLVRFLDYDSATGIFIWKVQMSSRALAGDIAGSPHPKLGHIGIQINGYRYLAHRLAWFYVYKEWPKGIIDHRDRNPKNNAIANLRDVNQSVNMHNACLRSDNKSGVPGVGYMPSKLQWRARINVRGKEVHLGTFSSFEQAVAAREKAEKELL